MIRVLHVINWFEAGGIEIQLLHILRNYDRSRFHMDVCTIGENPGSLADEASREGAEILSCPKSPNLLSLSSRFLSLVKNRGYHVVHSHFETWSGAILRGAFQAGIPVRAAQLHSMEPWPDEPDDSLLLKSARALVSFWGGRWLPRYATHMVAVSRAVMEARVPPGWRAGMETAIWTGGVDTDRFAPAPESRVVKDRSPIILWVGALRQAKRIDIQFRVIRAVRELMPDVRLLLVGREAKVGEWRERAARMGLEQAIDFLGPRGDIPEMMRSADIFLSTSEVEGLPTVLLEAQSCALPVVASDIPSHREALCPELHPYLFDLHESERGVDSIIEILSDARLRNDLGHRARRFVLERFDASVRLDELQNHYERWVGQTS